MGVLDTFVLVRKQEIISPKLVTTREYGRWFEETFGSDVAQQELYMKTRKGDKVVLQSHPGTRIGNFFDKTSVKSSKLKSWFILQDSPMMERLVKYKMAEQRDAIPISVNDEQHRNMIRVYTVQQIEFYIRSVIDKHFAISPYISQSKQVCVNDSNMNKLIIPEMGNHKKSTLF